MGSQQPHPGTSGTETRPPPAPDRRGARGHAGVGGTWAHEGCCCVWAKGTVLRAQASWFGAPGLERSHPTPVQPNPSWKRPVRTQKRT